MMGETDYQNPFEKMALALGKIMKKLFVGAWKILNKLYDEV